MLCRNVQLRTNTFRYPIPANECTVRNAPILLKCIKMKVQPRSTKVRARSFEQLCNGFPSKIIQRDITLFAHFRTHFCSFASRERALTSGGLKRVRGHVMEIHRGPKRHPDVFFSSGKKFVRGKTNRPPGKLDFRAILFSSVFFSWMASRACVA